MPEKIINDLEDMTIMEISLVDDPACPGADVILMKRRTDLVEEAVELLQREPYEKLINLAEALLKRDVADEPRDERGRWTHAAVQLLQQGHSKVSSHVIQGAKFLHGQAKEAATAVAAKTGKAVRSGVTAVRTTKLTGAHAVEGGGVQFNFEHGFTSGGRIETRVQVRPEHVAGSPTKTKALAAVHQYLASTRGNALKPFGEEGQSSWFRYEHREGPQMAGSSSYSSSSSSSLFRDQNNLPTAERGSNAHGLPTYTWHGRQPPEKYTFKEAEVHGRYGLIPATRSDVQGHIVSVHNRLENMGTEAAQRAREAMTLHDPSRATGEPFFLSTGEYVPAAPRWMQLDKFVKPYEEHSAGRARRDDATPARTILSSQLAPEPGPRGLHLGPSEAATVSDHFDDRMDREGSNAQWNDREHALNRMASAVVNERAAGMDLSREDVGHLERSMNRIPEEDQSSAHRDLHRKLETHLDYAKRRVRKLFA